MTEFEHDPVHDPLHYPKCNFKIFSIDEIDCDRIEYGNPLKSGDSQMIPLLYRDCDTMRPIIILTPEIYSPEDADKISTSKYTHEFILPLVGTYEETTEKLKSFFYGLDEKFINDGRNGTIKNVESYKFIVKKPSQEMSNDLFNDGIIKCKCINTEGLKTRFFNGNNKEIESGELDIEGAAVRLVFEIDCVWVRNKTFGVNMKVHQVKVLCEDSETCDGSDGSDDSYSKIEADLMKGTMFDYSASALSDSESK